jgi:hypothetical protein
MLLTETSRYLHGTLRARQIVLMAERPKSFGRADLVAKLKADCGLSRRQSVAVVNAVLEWASDHLCRGKTVEIPYGQLRRVRNWFGESWYEADDWPANRKGYTIVYEEILPWPPRIRKAKNPCPQKGGFRARKDW